MPKFAKISVKFSVLGSYTLIVAPMGWSLAWRGGFPVHSSVPNLLPSVQRVAPAVAALRQVLAGPMPCH